MRAHSRAYAASIKDFSIAPPSYLLQIALKNRHSVEVKLLLILKNGLSYNFGMIWLINFIFIA